MNRRSVFFSSSWLCALGAVAALAVAPSANAQAIDAKVLPLSAFSAPSAALSRACAIGSESARAQRAILGVKTPNDLPGASQGSAQADAAPPLPAADASADGSAAAASAPSPFPADEGSSLALQAGACRALEEVTPDPVNAPVVAEIPPYDFTEQNGQIQAVGAQGPISSLAVRSGSTPFSFAFWKSSGKSSAQSANSFIAGSRFIFFGRSGALYAFDRQTETFCSNAVEQPVAAFDRTLREMPNGSVILSVWTPGPKDEGPKLAARLLDADALCPRPATPAQ